MPWTEEDAKKALKARGIDTDNLGHDDPTPAVSSSGQNFMRGAVQGFALDPAQAVKQYAGYAGIDIPLPDAIKDPEGKYRQGVESSLAGQSGRVVGNIGAGLTMAGLAALAAPEAAATTAGGAIIGGISGLLSRPAQSWEEAIAQVVGGGGAGSLRGLALQRAAQQANALRAAQANSRFLTGVADRSALEAKYARQAAKQATGPMRAQLQQDALAAAEKAGLSRAEVAQAIENMQMLRQSQPDTWRWIMNAPHGFHGMIWRALSSLGSATAGRAPGAVGALAGQAAKGEQQ